MSWCQRVLLQILSLLFISWVTLDTVKGIWFLILKYFQNWWCTYSKSAFNMQYCFFHNQDSQVQKSRNRNGRGSTHSYWSISKIFYFFPHDLICCPRGVRSKDNSASTRRCNNKPIELEIEIATWSLWAPHAAKTTDKESSYYTAWNNWSSSPKAGQTITTQGREEWIYPEYRRSLRVFFSTTMLGKLMENCNNPIQAGLLMVHILQEWKFELSHQAKNHNQLRYLLREKGMWNRRK